LAIGEYDQYSGPHSFYIYDLKKQKKVFGFALPDGLGVTSLAPSPASSYLAVTAGDQNSTKPSRLYLVQLGSFEIVREHVYEGFSFYDLAFAGNDRLIGGVSDDDYESHLLDIDVHTGAIRWREKLGGIGVHPACHPTRNEVIRAPSPDGNAESGSRQEGYWSAQVAFSRFKHGGFDCRHTRFK
jgi:hypothetical protein